MGCDRAGIDHDKKKRSLSFPNLVRVHSPVLFCFYTVFYMSEFTINSNENI